MAMGYLNTCTSLVLSNSRLGVYSICSAGYRYNGDYLHSGGALDCILVVMAIGSCGLLWDRLFFGGDLVQLLSVGG